MEDLKFEVQRKMLMTVKAWTTIPIVKITAKKIQAWMRLESTTSEILVQMKVSTSYVM